MTQLETFISTGDIEISRHPITNIRRLLSLDRGFYWLPKSSQIVMDFTVNYLDETGNKYQLESIKSYNKSLIADIVNTVDSSGANDPSSTITEYQYFVNIANNNVNIFNVMLNTVLLRVSQGKFDM